MDIEEIKTLLKDLMGRFSKSSNAQVLLEKSVEFVESQQQEIERLKCEGWISVEDKPEQICHCLIYFREDINHAWQIAWAFYNSKGEYCFDNKKVKPVMWMNIPKAPEVV